MEIQFPIRTSDFLAEDRSHGEAYFEQGRVELEPPGARSIAADVEGSLGNQYRVSCELLTGDSMSVVCECPRFDSGHLCKHIWATVLAANAKLKSTSEGATEEKPWRQRLRHLSTYVRESRTHSAFAKTTASLPSVRYWFAVILGDQFDSSGVVVRIYRSNRRPDGVWLAPRKYGMDRVEMDFVGSLQERTLFSLLQPTEELEFYDRIGYSQKFREFAVPELLQETVLPLLAETERFVWTNDDRNLKEAKPLAWDGGEPWRLILDIKRATTTDGETQSASPVVTVAPRLVRGGETETLSNVIMSYATGLVMFPDRVARMSVSDSSWLQAWWTESTEITVAGDDLESFLEELAAMPGVPELHLEEGLDIRVRSVEPKPRLRITTPPHGGRDLEAAVVFKYEDEEIAATEQHSGVVCDRLFLRRDFEYERQRVQELTLLTQIRGYDSSHLAMASQCLPVVVRTLSELDWEVVADGKAIRSGGEFEIAVESGIDWFDVHAKIDFGGASTSLPSLLRAVRRRETFIVLDDGSRGVLPEEWLKRYAGLAEVSGVTEGESVRYRKSQALFLDMLLAEQENILRDDDFKKHCAKLASFDGVKPVVEPRGFQGILRPYQQQGLGWFKFLRDFEFGGCLADDMGLGKTVQVLALLESRRTRRPQKESEGERRPSLVVVPRSLVFNWLDEASVFAPKLRVFNYTGAGRKSSLKRLSEHDVIITTYGTLRNDIADLMDLPFDYVILDEAQAVKNASSQAAKAVRLVQADNRLAMTGTPVENHLGELWSLFDFLNPGMLGTSSKFRSQIGGKTSPESLEFLRRGLAPFILRRTKEEVLTDLPAKTEQTLYCEMAPQQAKLYRELSDHYRSHIDQKVREVGVKGAKFHVLEALLRLRQTACDPRLLDQTGAKAGAKLELLIQQLDELQREGHKALVFSQFTSLLALVRDELDKRKWPYAYLDGRTRDRGERVKHFQNEDKCKLFLISLKAGGHGLNLTAADYVFILDPWWNPAVEAQAVDRAHRIGQTRSVIAYRLICRGTVEEKIVELQKAKRELADAIISENRSLISKLSVDDLTMLFS